MSRRAILILKTGEALPPVKAKHGDFEDWIACGLDLRLDQVEVANAYLGEALPNASEIGGVVITGSPAMVTEGADWSERSARWIGEIVRKDAAPVLGLCYGHQLLAHALGGEVGTNPNGREMGTVDVIFDGDARDSTDAVNAGNASGDGFAPLFESGVFPGHMSHFESVLRPPEGARVLAHTSLDPNSVIEFGPRQWGVQFHPEFDRPILQDYVEARREILIGEGFDPNEMIESVTETPGLTGVLRRFARLVSGENGRAAS